LKSVFKNAVKRYSLGETVKGMVYPVQGLFLPKRFFITSGSAVSPISPLNAFDAALVKAGISQCNLVYVSSILPPDAEKVDALEITPGTVTFCVMARMDGNPEEQIGAGIGWGWIESSNGRHYGIVAEAHGYKDEPAIQKELTKKLQEMAKIRNMKLTSSEMKIECLTISKNMYGCAVVALIYVPWELEEATRETSKRYRLLNNLQEVIEKPNKPASEKLNCDSRPRNSLQRAL